MSRLNRDVWSHQPWRQIFELEYAMHVNPHTYHGKLAKFKCIWRGRKFIFEFFHVAVELYSTLATVSGDKMNWHHYNQLPGVTGADLESHAFVYYKHQKWLRELEIGHNSHAKFCFGMCVLAVCCWFLQREGRNWGQNSVVTPLLRRWVPDHAKQNVWRGLKMF